MRFSVTIPAYKAQFLEDAIRSVIGQSLADWELIIVDDCSPENLRTIVEPFLHDDRISYYRNSQNCGAVNVVENWNICLSYCTGDYVICMGDDDRLLPNCLADYKTLVEKYPELYVYHTRTEIINETGKVIDVQEKRPEYESALALLWNRWNHRNKQYIGDFCYRTDYLKGIGGYYKLPLAWGSDDITAVLAAKKKGIANMQTFGFQYRQNAQTISSTVSNARIKIEARVAQLGWFTAFLKEMQEQELSAAERCLLQTIDTPKRRYFFEALDKDCPDYIKGSPCRLWWCYRQLRPFRFPLRYFIRWYLKSVKP